MICKICNLDRELISISPYYGLLANKGKKKIKVCKACAIKLIDNSTKPYTKVLQSDLWDKPVKNSIDAVLRPLRRVNYMTRFGAEINANPESLAEHSYMVLVLSIQIAKTVIKQPVNFERLVSIAMFHDIAEIMTGDVPTPLKTLNIKQETDILEKQAVDILKNKWGLWMGAIEEYNNKDVKDIESRIVKTADYLSAIIYAVEESYIGSTNMKNVLSRSIKAFHKWAQLPWEKELAVQMIELIFQADLE